MLGLGRAGTRPIACDARQRIDVVALRAAIAEDKRGGVIPVAVVGTAGTTDTGAIDPLGDLAEVAREHGAWFHVDGAYGLIAAASPTLRPPSPPLSAPSRGVLAWAVLRELGRAGVAARVERHIGFARHLAQRARQHPRLELLLEPELSIVCFRYAASDAVNAEILLRLRRTTRSIPSSTVIGGRLAIRPCYINPHTRLADVDTLVDHVTTIGDELTGTQSG